MSSLQEYCTLCSILMLIGRNLAVLIRTHQDSINGTVGQSVLLPISYRFDAAPRFPVSFVWMFDNSLDILITCTVMSCSLDAGGAPSSCIANRFPRRTYQRRAEVFPENGSLLLQHLQLSDSGVYSVSFKPSYQTWRVTLTVHEKHFTPEHPGAGLGGGGGGTATRVPCYIFGGCYCFILLFLQLIFYLRWHRPNSWEASNTASHSVRGAESGQSQLQPEAALQLQ